MFPSRVGKVHTLSFDLGFGHLTHHTGNTKSKNLNLLVVKSLALGPEDDQIDNRKKFRKSRHISSITM